MAQSKPHCTTSTASTIRAPSPIFQHPLSHPTQIPPARLPRHLYLVSSDRSVGAPGLRAKSGYRQSCTAFAGLRAPASRNIMYAQGTCLRRRYFDALSNQKSGTKYLQGMQVREDQTLDRLGRIITIKSQFLCFTDATTMSTSELTLLCRRFLAMTLFGLRTARRWVSTHRS